MASRSSPRFSIIEVARKAGVSPATVSRAFNQPDIVHPDTLAHIRNVAKRAGFRPNRVGRSLRSGSTRTIGLILPTLSNPVFAECFEGAERRARESGYSVMLTATGYDPAVESAAVQGLMDHQVDGLILTVADVAKSATLDDLDSAGIPYVLVYNESAAHPYASVDNRAAASDMVAHLAALGHRRIALVTGPLTASDRARRRLAGARACAKKLGLDAVQHISMSSHTGSDADALKAALRGKQAPTALFCSNDLLATAVIADLVALGLSVPADISVCGFDGMRFGALLTPPLTTVAQPSDGIGVAACSNLLAQIHGHPPQSDRLPHCIVVGGTAAPVRRKSA
ncbi:substrate-binding domain-containing protein [Achromobacter veterisilvae]|jgi:DNA-binding LacI/PurR family transcriptional regulator|uniref:HTH-type transcriptional repressor CytR n=1 Tax=Achromobacter veterisilvae TaxID=2069367 RepID=A0A446D0T6_9BURK|nr:substrate-binding domain-containing protein [Achromobacter veterisilvae]SSW73710.1 HTH-type transcriptional repressor CytR [Achromobacter veterisilvae]